MKRALLLPVGFAAGIFVEWFALSFSVALPQAGCLPASASDAGPTGAQTSVCCGGGGNCSVNASCCLDVGGSCPDGDFECCSGLCSGGQCVQNATNPSCKAQLGSRCNAGSCTCASDGDCCIGGCSANTVGDADAGDLRCCLPSGSKCGTSADCCSQGCRADTLQCQ